MNKEYMSDDLFQELLESVREGGAILRGEKEASRTFKLEAPDVTSIRERYGLSQSEFAALLGISVKTLQNWEQGRRTPHGAARVLLQVASKHPEAVWDVVKPAKQQAAVLREDSPEYKT
jgi:putative transcriptional regulator